MPSSSASGGRSYSRTVCWRHAPSSRWACRGRSRASSRRRRRTGSIARPLASRSIPARHLGRGRLRSPLAVVGLMVLRRAGRKGPRALARRVGACAVRARSRRVLRHAHLPRPLPDHRCSRIRSARWRRSPGRRSARRRHARRGRRRRDERWPRPLVCAGRSRKLARRGLEASRPHGPRASLRERCRSWSSRGGPIPRRGTTVRIRPGNRPTTPLWVLVWSEDGHGLSESQRRLLGSAITGSSRGCNSDGG